MMLKLFYDLIVILNIVALIVLVAHHRTRISVFYTALFTAILIANFGYLQVTSAPTLEAALLANQTVYLGASFTSFFLFMCLADLCNVRIPLWVKFMWLALSCFILLCVVHPPLNPYFYTSVRYVQSYQGVGMLKKDYGPLHLLYLLSIAAAVGGGLWIIADSFQRKRQVSLITSWMLLADMLLTVLCYVIEKSASFELPLVPVGYVFGELIILILLHRVRLYQVDAIAEQFHVEQDTSGYVIISDKGTFLGCNNQARQLFPELCNLRIDSKNKRSDLQILKKTLKWVEGKNTKSSDFYWERTGKGVSDDDRCIGIEYKKLAVDSRNVHVFKISDITEEKRAQDNDKKLHSQMRKELRSTNAKIRSMENDIITSLASYVENRDGSTGGHVERTRDIVDVFTTYLLENENPKAISTEQFDRIVRAAPLHDFGKIAVPDRILNKPSGLDDEEFGIMKTHSEKGADMVEDILQHAQDIEFKNVAVNVARYHHEKWDGRGYPEGLAGDKIPYEARIMALADSFDAMVSKRDYQQNPKSLDEAFEEIERCKGKHFDPVLAEQFVNCRKEIEQLYPHADMTNS